MRSKISVAFLLCTLVGVVSALAYPECSCTCSSSCTATCVGSGGLTSCGALGELCSGNSACGGGGCGDAVSSFLERMVSQHKVVAAGANQGRAAARLTWRLAQYVEQGGLGEVYSGSMGFLMANGQGGFRVPYLAFVSRAHTTGAADQSVVPDLVALFTSPTNPERAAEDANAWLQAGTHVVLTIDANQKTVAVYRGAGQPETAGADAAVDLSKVIPGFTLGVNDLFD